MRPADEASRLDVAGHQFSGEDFDAYQDFTLNPAGQITGLDLSNPVYHFDGTGTALGIYVPNGLNQYSTVNGKTVSAQQSTRLTTPNRSINRLLSTFHGSSCSTSSTVFAPGNCLKTCAR